MLYLPILSLLILLVGYTEGGATQPHEETENAKISYRLDFSELEKEEQAFPYEAEQSPRIMNKESVNTLDWLPSSSEISKAIRSKDWSMTPLGPIESWPSPLVNVLSLCLSSHFPMAIGWGPDFVFFYNDAYRPIAGDKHPQCLGRNGRDVWLEIWDIIGPILERVRETGQAVLVDDQLLPMNRFGYVEECYLNYNMSPIKISDGTVGGVLNIVVENTYRVFNERRQKLLRELAVQTASSKSARDVCELAANVFAKNTIDIPFALLYLIDLDKQQVNLAGSSGFQANDSFMPDVVDLTDKESILGKWPINIAVNTNTVQTIPDLFKHFGTNFKSYWPETTREALVLPICTSGHNTRMLGVLVAGINPRHALDNDYYFFFDLVAGQIATAIVNAHAYEEEKKRVERLEELDRAKTVFFSNISHEFRTPLTLMLSPLEDVLVDQTQPLSDPQFKRLEMVKRNALRLHKLVNSLLDFSRIEAGRVQAHFVPVDLAKYTTDLVSVFRSAIEKAGLILCEDIESTNEPVYIDKDSWEKIIFNLLSNALKFTHQGSITVALKECADRIEVQVIDTGVGIPKQELPNMFQRFHRIENVHGRSQEGTGIGLALTQELVKLHGGNIQVESKEGKGSVFTVSLPLGKAHLPPDRINEEIMPEDKTGTLSVPFVEEAFSWLPINPEKDIQEEPIEVTGSPILTQPTVKETILLADDNSDMQEYVRQLLSRDWKVYTVADGKAALQVARVIEPDLILSDVMMPKMDGLQLTRELRKDPKTALIPIILLSARAGEESSREGLQQGADDYIFKPFTAQALITRVRAHMELGRLRIQLDKAVKERTRELQETIEDLKKMEGNLRESEESYRILTTVSPVGVFHCDKEGKILFLNKKCSDITGLPLETIQESDSIQEEKKWTKALHPEDKEHVFNAWKDFIEKRTNSFKEEYRFVLPNSSIVWVIGEAVAEKDEQDQVKGYVGTLTDISEIKALEKARLEVAQQLEEQQRKRAQEAESARKNLESFMNMVCHEIRNPLTGIYGNISFLEETSKSLKSCRDRLSTEARLMFNEPLHELDKSIKQISECAKHQKAITDDVLDLSKLEVGKATFTSQPFRLKAIIEEVAQIFASPLALKKLPLVLKLPKTDPWIEGDANRLKIVLINLITNAMKFTEQGHIEVSLNILDMTPAHTTFTLSVEDTGIGITPEELAQLFQRFIQVASAEYEGSGLGLLISKRIIKSMGGQIDVKSQKGQGSQFIVKLTCKSAEAEKQLTPIVPQVLPAAPLTDSGTAKRILVVEDNKMNQTILLRLLVEAGYSCEVANNGQEALSKWSSSRSSSPFDLIFMDIAMPVMGGLEATQAIREREGQSALAKRIPIVALSAYEPGEYMKESCNAGIDDYLSKPYNKKRLCDAIKRWTTRA